MVTPRLGLSLWSICVKNNHGYVPFGIFSVRFYTHSWLIIGFVTIVRQRLPPEFTSGIQWGSCYSSICFLFNVLQLVACPLVLFWHLWCLSFDLRRMVTLFCIFKLSAQSFVSSGFEQTIYRFRSDHDDYYTTKVITIYSKVSTEIYSEKQNSRNVHNKKSIHL